MNYLCNEFEKARNLNPISENILPVISIPSMEQHKLGSSTINQPIFFIQCENPTKSIEIDYNLDLIKVEYSRKCTLTLQNGQSIDGLYTLITLKQSLLDVTQYFLDAVYLMLSNLPQKILVRELKLEIIKLVTLFNSFSASPIKTIQGLWAELLIIERSKDPEYLIKSWHNNTLDKYDFNDGNDKIEVKSTMKSKRVHTFSLEQLTPNNSSQLLIISVLMYQTGMGKNIFDLLELIDARDIELQLRFKLREQIAICIGRDIEKVENTYFDYQ